MQLPLLRVEGGGLDLNRFRGEVLFVDGVARVEDVQNGLLPFEDGRFQAAFGFVALQRALTDFLFEAFGLCAEGVEPFALLDQIELPGRPLLFEALRFAFRGRERLLMQFNVLIESGRLPGQFSSLLLGPLDIDLARGELLDGEFELFRVMPPISLQTIEILIAGRDLGVRVDQSSGGRVDG